MFHSDFDPFDEPYRLGRHRGFRRCPTDGPAPLIGIPRAGIDPIDSEASALGLISLAASPRPMFETIAVLLDHQRRGLSILCVGHTFDPESVLHVADNVVESAHQHDEIGAVVIASVRPGGGDELDDLDRWFTIDEELNSVGVELVEWFVLGDGVSRPRSLVGAPDRWVA